MQVSVVSIPEQAGMWDTKPLRCSCPPAGACNDTASARHLSHPLQLLQKRRQFGGSRDAHSSLFSWPQHASQLHLGADSEGSKPLPGPPPGTFVLSQPASEPASEPASLNLFPVLLAANILPPPLPQEPAYNPAYRSNPLKTWVNVDFGKDGVGWLCGAAGAFSELGGVGSGTCDTLYRSIEYMLTNSDFGKNYKNTAFFGDAIVLGVTVMQANPGLVSYWNNLEVSLKRCCGTTGSDWGGRVQQLLRCNLCRWFTMARL